MSKQMSGPLLCDPSESHSMFRLPTLLQIRSTMRTSTLLLTVSLFALLCGLAAAAHADETQRPNVLVILADDMGYGDVQALNKQSAIPTPHLNELAKQGMTFTDAHSPSAVCTPTRYGLLTGRYCWRTELKRGVLGGYSKPLIAPDRKTIADFLKQHGYATAAVGKWHLGMDLPMLTDDADTKRWDGDPGIDWQGVIRDSPIHHGFDYYFGVSASLDMAPYVYIRNDRFTKVPTLQQPAVRFPHFVRKGPRADDFEIEGVLDKLTEEAVGFISRSSKQPAPWFLYVPLTGPHKPTQPHPRFRGKTTLNEYGDFVHQVDWTVGRILQAVQDYGQYEHTLVVFTSDNGSYMYRFEDPAQPDHTDDETVQGFRTENHRANGPLRGTKADVWEAGHRVPLFVRWPQKIEADSTSATTVCLTDLFATCAAIIGKPIPDDAAEDSASLLPVLTDPTADRGAPVINHSANGIFAIRDGRWKLVAGTGSGGRQAPRGKPFAKPYQLYDLQLDLAEANDVAGDHPEIVERLTERLQRAVDAERSVDR